MHRKQISTKAIKVVKETINKIQKAFDGIKVGNSTFGSLLANDTKKNLTDLSNNNYDTEIILKWSYSEADLFNLLDRKGKLVPEKEFEAIRAIPSAIASVTGYNKCVTTGKYKEKKEAYNEFFVEDGNDAIHVFIRFDGCKMKITAEVVSIDEFNKKRHVNEAASIFDSIKLI